MGHNYLGNHITDRNAAAFAGALRANTTLSYLDLSHNEFGELGAISLANGIVSLAFIVSYKLYSCIISD